VIVFDNMW